MSSVQGDLKQINVWPYVCGGTAAVVAEVITFPLDTAKTLLQVQGKAGSLCHYNGTVHCISQVQ